MRIDSHQHFWDFGRNAAGYSWIDESMVALRRSFLPADLEPLLRSRDFEGCVAVQAREVVEETDDLLGLADRHAFIKGVVGWVDLCDPQVEALLERYSGRNGLVGLRMAIHDRADPGFASSPAHARGVGLLARYGLTYDLLLRPQHLGAAADLVKRWPNQPFVIDHLAKPDLRLARDEAWFAGIGALAACDNVLCKLSGLVTEADASNWRSAPFDLYLDHALELFGPKRLMIGSDWPVCTLAATYKETIDIVARWAGRLSQDEREALRGGDCTAFYGLDP